MSKYLLLLIVLLAAFPARAQEIEDTIKIKTRVVFLDALVKDKKTSIPISNLTSENFAVLDDGKPRDITYFTREGQARKPLALKTRPAPHSTKTPNPSFLNVSSVW